MSEQNRVIICDAATGDISDKPNVVIFETAGGPLSFEEVRAQVNNLVTIEEQARVWQAYEKHTGIEFPNLLPGLIKFLDEGGTFSKPPRPAGIGGKAGFDSAAVPS